MIEHVTKNKSIRQKFYSTIRNEFVTLINNILKHTRDVIFLQLLCFYCF